MDFIQGGGTILFVGAIILIVLVTVVYIRRNRAGAAGWIAFGAGLQSRPDPIAEPESHALPTDSMSDSPMDEKLEKVEGGKQFVTLLGEQPVMITSRVTLHEMTQRTPDIPDSSWTQTGVDLTALALSDGRFILKIRKREQDDPFWLIGKRVSTDKLGSFYKGDKTNPGPARLFRNNNQTTPIPYTLPSSPGGNWQIVDIGTYDAEVTTDLPAMKNGDRLYFVTSTGAAGEWLFYLDARQGEARGTGGLFQLKEFAPESDVMVLL